MTLSWRLIPFVAAPGAHNMAVDEAIMEAVSQGLAPPTLRLYAWNPACVSLGYAQPYEDLDEQVITRNGWDLVRRITGGRAILHTDELTYAVIGRESHPILDGGVLESYRKISVALLDGLQRLVTEISIHPQRMDPVAAKNPVCFQNPSAYEIKFQNKKLLGSAQVRRKQVVLQHGTLPLLGDIGRIGLAISYPETSTRFQAMENIRKSATTLEEVAGKRIGWEEVAQALIEGFEATFGLDFFEGELTVFEKSQIQTILHAKYSSEAWIRRK
jgi:lipoate-protein ligase A